MRHYSFATCDDCGERHTPDNPAECIEGLASDRDSYRADLGDALTLVSALEGQLALQAISTDEAEARATMQRERAEKAEAAREEGESDE